MVLPQVTMADIAHQEEVATHSAHRVASKLVVSSTAVPTLPHNLRLGGVRRGHGHSSVEDEVLSPEETAIWELLQVSVNASLELTHIRDTLCLQHGAGLLAPDPTSTVHEDSLVLQVICASLGEAAKLRKGLRAGYGELVRPFEPRKSSKGGSHTRIAGSMALVRVPSTKCPMACS